jgi:hypothetical protein
VTFTIAPSIAIMLSGKKKNPVKAPAYLSSFQSTLDTRIRPLATAAFSPRFFLRRNSLWPPTDTLHKDLLLGRAGPLLPMLSLGEGAINKRKNDGGNFGQDKE